MKKVWAKQNNCLFLRDISATQEALDKKIYVVEQSIEGLYLKEMFDKFKFDFKIYGLETAFIKRVIKTYKNTTGNLGIALNGVKGTGKTITAEVICNEIGLPVIMISANYPGLNEFLADITEDVVVLIDEYEKVFKGSVSEEDYDYDGSSGDPTLLSIMDGVYKTQHRKIFILTTNHRWLNDNMVNRPGRIRYLKSFDDLSIDQITEIVDDCLKYPVHKLAVMDFLKPLRIITVDIVKCIISEVNIHNEPPSDCCQHFNLERKEAAYDVFEVKGKKEVVLHEGVDRKYVDRIVNKGRWKGNYLALDSGEVYYLKAEPDYKTLTFPVALDNVTNMVIRVKKTDPKHKSFAF